MSYLTKHLVNPQTAQTSPIPGREAEMVKNAAGGYTFSVGVWGQLERFLILGSEGNTFYATEAKLTLENTANLQQCLREDGLRVVNLILEMREHNRAPRLQPLLFALALASRKGDDATKIAANNAVSKICWTMTQLNTWLNFVKALGKISSGQQRAVRRWYETREARTLANQIVKYNNREGWTARDTLRVAHPRVILPGQAEIYEFAKPVEKRKIAITRPFLVAAEELKGCTNAAVAAKLISDYKLPWEAVPTALRKERAVTEALLPNMGLTALLRQLGRLAANGDLEPLSHLTKLVASRIADVVAIKDSKIHPIAVLSALTVYEQGHGVKGSLTWRPNQTLIEALNHAFIASFANVTPTGKNFYLGLDVSGSMGAGLIAGVPGLTPRLGSSAMALVTAKLEPFVHVAGFTDGQAPSLYGWNNRHANKIATISPTHLVSDLHIGPSDTLKSANDKVSGLPFGGTDCALPMLDAIARKMEIDAFVIYTDNETYAGNIHPLQALDRYEQAMGRPAKLIAVGMTATKNTIVRSSDPRCLNVVGFDSTAPAIISQFVG